MRKSVIATLTIAVLVLIVQILRPLPALQVKSVVRTDYRVPGSLNIKWPTQGSAAIEVDGVGLMGSSNANQVLPMASVAKLMTAYLTLQKHPLGIGATGPALTVTAADLATYRADSAQQNSVARVALGERLTERQLLEALLIPSGNNIATLLAQWDAGSVSQFVQEMNQTAKKLGMIHTHYADPAGVNPATVSSALDQLKIAQADMAIPAFRHIVRMRQATLPVGPVVYNTDYVLGQNGIIGVKTGSMPEAGGNFVFATEPRVNGKKILLLGCVMAQQGLEPLMDALHEGASLALQASRNLEKVTLVKSGSRAAVVSSAWGQSDTVDTSKSMSVIAWPGLSVKELLDTKPLRTVNSNAVVGRLTVSAGSQTSHIPLQAAGSIMAPTLVWKLKRGIS